MTKKTKLFLPILALVVCMLFANLSSASMHHMDDSDCMEQTTCNNCFISVVTNSPVLKFFLFKFSPNSETFTSFKSSPIAPPSPPPKF